MVKVNLDTDLDGQLEKVKELAKYLHEIETGLLQLQFISIKDFSKITSWSPATVKDLYNRPDFPSTDFGKEKKAEIHAIIEYFKVPRRK